MQVQFRDMTPDDTDAIIDVHRRSVYGLCKGSYSREQMTVWTGMFSDRIGEGIKDPDNKGIVAVSDGEVVGYGFINLKDKEVKGMYIVPGLTGEGIGRDILSKLESIAREHGLDGLVLDSTLNAVAFYEKCGYTRIRDEVFKLTDTCELSCVRMVKDLK